MGRNNSHYRYTNGISFFGDSIRASALTLFVGIFEVLCPLIAWPIVAILAVVMRMEWPSSFYVLTFLGVVPFIIGAVLFALSQKVHMGVFIHGTVSAFLISALLFVIVLGGWTKFAIFMMVAAVPVLCITWSIRIGMMSAKGRGLDHIFAQAGIEGAQMTIHKSKD